MRFDNNSIFVCRCLYFFRYMHGRPCSKSDDNSTVDSLEMPIPSSSVGRTRRTGLLTVMERPPGKNVKNHLHCHSYCANLIKFQCISEILTHIHTNTHFTCINRNQN